MLLRRRSPNRLNGILQPSELTRAFLGTDFGVTGHCEATRTNRRNDAFVALELKALVEMKSTLRLSDLSLVRRN
jgi:hypothetical protein